MASQQHMTQHKKPRDGGLESIDANDWDGVLCRSENRFPGLSASSLNSESGPEFSGGGFRFLISVAVVFGLSLCRVFIFRSSCSVSLCPRGFIFTGPW